MSELWRHSALDLARLIAARKTSSAEVVEAHLARIEAVNPKLNAIVRVLADEARAGAREADRRQAAGQPLGPLHGVPITVKANIDMAGLPTTNGVIPLAEAIAPVDAPVVERMRAAGAVPIGRTNLPDMGLRVHTDSSLHGLTRNPWRQDRTAGGSSGGEASALASGMSPLGLGNDIGGSLRNPAGVCGIASIRPSAGRVPDALLIPSADRLLSFQAMAVQGPMARRVADVRAGLRILSGAHPRDPWSLDVAFDGPAEHGPVRVAVVAAPPGGTTDPAIEAATLRAADALADAGYAVETACPPRFEESLDVWRRFLLGDMAAVLEDTRALMGPDAVTFLEAIYASTPPMTRSAEFSLLMAERDGLARDWSLFMARYPLVLTPTWTQPAFEHGYDIASPAASLAVIELMRPVLPANLLGLPSACVPAGRDPASGVPMGVLLTGRRMRDDQCLDAAEAIEARLGLDTPIDPAW
jgi:amidase